MSAKTLTAIEHMLSLVRDVTGADAVLLSGGVERTSWGAADLCSLLLPQLKMSVCVRDALLDSRLASQAKRTGFRSALGVPMRQAPGEPVVATLWLVSHQPNVFAPEQADAIDRHASVLAKLVQPADEAEQLKRFVAALPTAAICVNPDGNVFPNAHASTLTGYEASETPTRQLWFHQLYGAEAVTVQALYEVDRAQGFIDSRTFPLTRRDGSERLVEFGATSIGEHEIWLLTDVTERVASQERFRLLFEQSSTAHLLFDSSGVLDCNPAAVALLGYRTKSELLRVNPMELSPEKQPDGLISREKSAQMELIAFELGSHRFDWTYRTASGQAAPVEVTLTPLTLGARRILMAEWHDITERLRYEEGLTRARDTALEFARAKADFLATMSHEIRTPMNGVIGMTRLLSETPLNREQREYVETVRACGDGLLALINDILDFSKLEAGRVALENIPFSVRDLIEDALAVVSMSAHQKGLELVSVVAPHVPDLCMGDPTRLRQVLLNLLSNAVKFTTDGEVNVKVEAPQRDGTGRRVISFSVTDSGVGIAPDALPRLFSAFSQEDTSTTRRFGGTGLGLAICKRLLGLMGGIVDVTTSKRGTTFTVTLALTEIADDAAPDLRGREVLVVAGSVMVERSLVALLEAAGATVRMGLDVASARSLVPGSHVIVVNEMVTGGEAFARELAAQGRRVGFLSSKPGAANRVDGLAFTLPKPVRRKQLYASLASELIPSYVSGTQQTVAPVNRVSGAKILVAEDNPVNQRVIRGLLGKLGCEVTLADNGARALEQLEKASFDVVLMDCQMPELDGYEATQRLREREKTHHTPVIALTAAAMGGDRERCLAAGMDDFLAKPIRLEDLERTLAKWIHKDATETAA